MLYTVTEHYLSSLIINNYARNTSAVNVENIYKQSSVKRT